MSMIERRMLKASIHFCHRRGLSFPFLREIVLRRDLRGLLAHLARQRRIT